MIIYRWLRTRQWKQQCIRNGVTQPCTKPSIWYVRIAYWGLSNHLVTGGVMTKSAENILPFVVSTLQWRHNMRYGVSNHQPHICLLKRLFRRRSKKTSKLSITGLCEGNSPVTGEFPAQMASNMENVSIWWRHHDRLTWWKPWILFHPLFRNLLNHRESPYERRKAVVTHNANVNIVAMPASFHSGWTIPNLNITGPGFPDVMILNERPRSE